MEPDIYQKKEKQSRNISAEDLGRIQNYFRIIKEDGGYASRRDLRVLVDDDGVIDRLVEEGVLIVSAGDNKLYRFSKNGFRELTNIVGLEAEARNFPDV